MSKSHMGLKSKRYRFFDRTNIADEWDTTYKKAYPVSTKPPSKIKENYQSPYKQQFATSIQPQHERRRLQLETLGQAFLVSEPLIQGMPNLYDACSDGDIQEMPSVWNEWGQEEHDTAAHCCLESGQDIPTRKSARAGGDVDLLGGSSSGRNDWTKLRVYTKAMPTVQRQPLPSDISEPKCGQLQARDWKGVTYPFVDPRFTPLLPVSLDASIAPTTLDPFRYCQRKRVFPQFNRCPNLPVSEAVVYALEAPGSTTMESKLYDKRWARRRFPRPPEVFITRLW